MWQTFSCPFLAVCVNGHAVVGGVEQFLVGHVHRAVLGQVEGVGAGRGTGQAVALTHGLHKDTAGQSAPTGMWCGIAKIAKEWASLSGGMGWAKDWSECSLTQQLGPSSGLVVGCVVGWPLTYTFTYRGLALSPPPHSLVSFTHASQQWLDSRDSSKGSSAITDLLKYAMLCCAYAAPQLNPA